MKRLLGVIAFIVLFSLSSRAQNKELTFKQYRVLADTIHFDSPLVFKFVDTVSFSKNKTYQRIVRWLATDFENLKQAAQIKDSLAGEIIVPDCGLGGSSSILFSMVIDVREGRYRLAFGDWRRKSGEYIFYWVNLEKTKDLYFNPGGKFSFWQVEKYKAMKEVQGLFNELQVYIRKQDDF